MAQPMNPNLATTDGRIIRMADPRPSRRKTAIRLISILKIRGLR